MRSISKEQRERLLGTFFLLGILAGMPALETEEWGMVKILTTALWLAVFLCAAVVSLAPSWIGPVWLLSLSVCLLAYFKLKVFYPLVMMLLWGLWFWFRSHQKGHR